MWPRKREFDLRTAGEIQHESLAGGNKCFDKDGINCCFVEKSIAENRKRSQKAERSGRDEAKK